VQPPPQPAANTIAANLQVASLLDTMSVRVVPERALGKPFTIAFVIPDMNERHLVTIANGVMLHEQGAPDAAEATLTAPRLALIAMVGGQAKAIDLLRAGTIAIAGDPALLQRFMTLFDPPRQGFPLVTP
jgi:alkyl sulfatase BDS1-like metallo-beta-lactamase superfamily hydrolase